MIKGRGVVQKARNSLPRSTSAYTPPTVNTTGYVNFNGGTAAASNYGSLSGAAGCIVVQVGGVVHYVP